MMMKMVRKTKNNPVIVSASCWQIAINLPFLRKVYAFRRFLFFMQVIKQETKDFWVPLTSEISTKTPGTVSYETEKR